MSARSRSLAVLTCRPPYVWAVRVVGTPLPSSCRLSHACGTWRVPSQPPNRKEALACLKRAVELAPEDVEALVSLALLYQLDPRPESLAAARKHYEDAYRQLLITKQPVPPQLQANLGALRQRLGDTTGAERMYLKALSDVAEAQVHTHCHRIACSPLPPC